MVVTPSPVFTPLIVFRLRPVVIGFVLFIPIAVPREVFAIVPNMPIPAVGIVIPLVSMLVLLVLFVVVFVLGPQDGSHRSRENCC